MRQSRMAAVIRSQQLAGRSNTVARSSQQVVSEEFSNKLCMLLQSIKMVDLCFCKRYKLWSRCIVPSHELVGTGTASFAASFLPIWKIWSTRATLLNVTGNHLLLEFVCFVSVSTRCWLVLLFYCTLMACEQLVAAECNGDVSQPQKMALWDVLLYLSVCLDPESCSFPCQSLCAGASAND